jgi:hypothetical protein
VVASVGDAVEGDADAPLDGDEGVATVCGVVGAGGTKSA